ncbi:polyketide synthase [Fusarium beomiforme]|uniref:Polyketide synthase n=1 Tax=Fusarium beomiforme TaxID=44412 RepID=A0A9P5AAG3_9HYPO|nr:polyketide synthase [Fusarium beomiforme]
MSSNTNNNQAVQNFEDNTATPSARVPSNQNNQFVLQPAQYANSLPGYIGTGQRVREADGFFTPIPVPVLAGQENLTVSQPVHNVFDVNGWMVQNTPAGANHHLHLLTPQQLHTANNTTFVPAGNPVAVTTTPHGYHVEGNWHMGQIHSAINERMARPAPDAVPFWTSNGLVRQGQAYRADLQDNLPPYAWDYSSTPWTEPRNSLEWRFRKVPRQEILGSRCRGVNPSAPTWRNKVSMEDAPWLVDHQVNGIVTFSFTIGIAMVVEAMMQVQEEAKEIDWANHLFEFEDFVFSNSIILPDETPIDFFLTLMPENDNVRPDKTWYDFTISSLRGDVDIRHCHGKAAVLETGKDDANRSGYFQEIDTLLLPSRMKRISIRMPAENTEIASCTINTSPVGFSRIEGTVECYDALSKPYFVVEGLQMDRTTSDDQTTLPWLRLIWRPDIGDISNNDPMLNSIQIKRLLAEKNLVNLENLVKELIPLIVENSIEKGKDLASHLQMYRSWLLDQADLHKERPLARHQLESGFATVQGAISNVVSNSGISQTVDASIVSQLAINMGSIFRGEVETLAVWLEDDLLYRFYEESIFTTSMNQKLLSVAELLAHKDPNVRILEIGAGTGGATTEHLGWFFDKAKKKFAEWDRIEFKTLDIEKDVSEQGFTEKYDLVVAANVLHATADLKFAMKNIRSLLRDGGYLLVGELPEVSFGGYALDHLAGSGPGLTMDEWREELAEDSDSVFEIEARHDKSDIDQLSSTVVTMARAKLADYTLPESLFGQKVHIAGIGSDLSTRDHIERYLGKRGISATSCDLEELSSQWSGDWLILVGEAEGSLLASIRPEQLEALKSWLTKPLKCIWITRKVYLDPQNTTGGLVTGFARILRMENSQLELYALDLSSEGYAIANIIYHFLERIHYSHDDPIPELDY